MDMNVATVVFAAIVASLIALPTPAVTPHQSAPVALAQSIRQDRLAVQRALTFCSQQTWPNLDNSCLRYDDNRPSTHTIRLIGGDQR
jgi:hypothetical protein